MNENAKAKIIEEYWLNHLKGHLPKIILPIFHQKKIRDGNSWREIKVELPADTRAVLKKVSNESDVALLILLLAGLQVGLHRYTGVEDLVIGTVPPKKTSEMGPVIFYRNLLSEGETLRELVTQTKEILMEGFAYSMYTFAKLYQNLQERTAPESCEILNVALIYDRLQNRVAELAQFELLFILSEVDEKMYLTAEYNAVRYDEELVGFFCANLLKILSNIPANLEKVVGQIDILSEDECKELFLFNCTDGTYPAKTLHGLFEEQVEKTPDLIALVYRGEDMTYREVDERASRLATVLKERGAESGQVVGLLTNISHELVIGILAVLKTGAAYMPLNPEDPAERITYMLDDSSAEIVLFEPALREKLYTQAILVELKDYGNYQEGEENFVAPEDLAYVIYTSGSTGQPKGVMIEHRNIVNQLVGLKNKYKFLLDTNHILLAPPTFDPSVQQIFWPLILGGKLHLVDKGIKSNPLELFRYIVTEKIDVVNTVPSLMNLMIDYADVYPNTHFKMIILAGEVFSKTLHQRIRENFKVEKLINIYGPTEATINTTLYECKESEEGLSIPIGQPLMNYNVWILDETKKMLPVGVTGEMYISGPGLARGYINKLEHTIEKFIPCPFSDGKRMYRTGDKARWLPDGNIEFIGREDYQVKINGIRIELDEIVERLTTHPSIKDAVVLDCDGSYLCAFVITDVQVEVLNLKDYLIKSVPTFMVPSIYIKIDAIPLTANGKVDRKALMKLKEDSRTKVQYVVPEDDIERGLLDIWKKILGVDDIGVLDNFYELGGNSLKTITMIAEIHKRFQVQLEVQGIFTISTIRGIKGLISATDKMDFQSIQPVGEQEYYDMTPSQKRMWVMDQLKEEESHNIFISQLLSGKLQLHYFEKALHTLVERHESFRTTFLEVDGKIRQKIHKHINVPLNYFDFRMYSDAESRAREMAEKESAIGFNLVNGPLIKVKIIRIKDEKYVFLLTLHHIISDTWSMGIVFNELLTLYTGFSAGKENPLPKMRLQYKDYAYWLDNYLAGEKLIKDEVYWLNQLGGDLAEIDLPSDRPRKEVRSTNAEIISFILEDDMVEKIDRISQKYNLTLFMTLFSAYSVFIYKYTDEQDIIINCLTAGRNHKDLENIVGFFVNTLPIRIKINPSETFKELLIRVKNIMTGAYEHQLYSFDQIVDKLNIKRKINRALISDIDFSVSESMYSVELGQLAELKIDNFEVDKDEDKNIDVDIFFEFIRVDKEISANIKYKTDLFDESRIQLIKKRYMVLLKNLLNKPNEKISNIHFLTEEDKSLEKILNVDFDF